MVSCFTFFFFIPSEENRKKTNYTIVGTMLVLGTYKRRTIEQAGRQGGRGDFSLALLKPMKHGKISLEART